MTKILVIDDDIEFCETMESMIRRLEYDFSAAHTISSGLSRLSEESFDLVFLDVRLPDGNGLDALPRIKTGQDSPEVIILTGQGDPDGAELAIRGGVWDYLLKPCSIKQTRLTLSRALKYRSEKCRSAPRPELDLSAVVGISPGIKKCKETVAQASKANSQVLITGETGTGKELFAGTIHANSARSEHNFIVVDCASLTETLLESTLFGHRKGAFTGAGEGRTGLVKLADRGTLFLDEVGDMPLSMQKSFLRVLQEKRFRPVGETKEVTSDFRLIAATNRNLEEMVQKGEFRQDLLYRLCTVSLKIPPLRERLADIKPLALFFINRLSDEYNMPKKNFDPAFIETLTLYSWPGNVREFFNVMEMAFMNSEQEPTLFPMHLPSDIRIQATRRAIGEGLPEGASRASGAPGTPGIPALSAGSMDTTAAGGTSGSPITEPRPADLPESLPSLKAFKGIMEKKYLERLISDTSGNPRRMMEISGLSKSHLYTLLRKYDLRTSGE